MPAHETQTDLGRGMLRPYAKPRAMLVRRHCTNRSARYFFFPFALFSSTTACAAASREIGTRNGDALT
jgi:hypothetical protein